MGTPRALATTLQGHRQSSSANHDPARTRAFLERQPRPCKDMGIPLAPATTLQGHGHSSSASHDPARTWASIGRQTRPVILQQRLQILEGSIFQFCLVTVCGPFLAFQRWQRLCAGAVLLVQRRRPLYASRNFASASRAVDYFCVGVVFVAAPACSSFGNEVVQFFVAAWQQH